MLSFKTFSYVMISISAVSAQNLRGLSSDHGCLASAGQSWCQPKHKCLRFDENCPIKHGGEKVEGSAQLSCNHGKISNLPKECTLTVSDGDELLAGPTIKDLNGEYVLPEGCSATVKNCSYTKLLGRRALAEQHGCKASAGYSYCESLQKCLRPFEENCPVDDGEGFHGEMTFECTNGQCSDLTCDVYDINNKQSLKGPSLLGLTGDYYLPAGCSTICDSNCEIKTFPSPQTDGHGCKASAGYSWCPETTSCIRYSENCPIKGGTKMSGAKNLTCSKGARLSDLTKECDLTKTQDDGTPLTLGGPYVSGMEGQYVLPEGCSATVVGCTTQNLLSF